MNISHHKNKNFYTRVSMDNAQIITGFINIYTREARDRIYNLGREPFTSIGLETISGEVFSCVDELIKNAVKANYKFLLIKEKLQEIFSTKHPDKGDDEIEAHIDSMIKSRSEYDQLANDILAQENISDTVRLILDQEAELLALMNKKYHENRDHTEEEEQRLEELELINSIRQKLRDEKMKVILSVHCDGDIIDIEVTNTAPLLRRDLERINNKRLEYQKYKSENREQEFFVNNLDTSESGFGLGYAIIDSFLHKWGLDPMNTATIIPASNTTVMLTLPVEKLKKHINI